MRQLRNLFIVPAQINPAPVAVSSEGHSATRWMTLNPLAVIFLGGLNLVLIQWILVRELTTLLLGTELVVLLITGAYFVGLSIGYVISSRIPQGWLLPCAMLMIALHLSLPIWFRLITVGLLNAKAYWLAFIIFPIAIPFIVSSFYSIFLPRFADSSRMGMGALYAVELIGSATGVLILVAFGGLGLPAVLVVYAISGLLLLLLLGARRVLVLAVLLIFAIWLSGFETLNKWSNARWFETIYHLPDGMETLFSAYSAYQKVDILQASNGARYLYLDGLLHFGTDRWSRLNVVMGSVPADVLQPKRTLVIGAGSMEMERFIAERGGLVTTVELDPVVVEASSRFLSDYNLMDVLSNRRIVIDDAKHFVANTDESYDLIATDVPSPFAIQTATLYSVPFYQQIAKRLSAQGVLVVNLTTVLTNENETARRIVASLIEVFPDVVVVTSRTSSLSFAFASNHLPFNLGQLAEMLMTNGETDYVIMQRDIVIEVVGDAAPITLDSMDLVLRISASRIADRLK